MSPLKLFAVIFAVIIFEVSFGAGIILYEAGGLGVGVDTTGTPACVNKTTIKYIDLSNITPQNISVYGVGVHMDNETGELIEIQISMKPGSGRTFFDSTFTSYGTDLQDSIDIVKSYAEKYTEISLDDYDLSIKTTSQAHIIEGSSASATMTVGLIALMENKTVPENIVMTGTVDEYGRIWQIAEIDVKIKVADDMGIVKMLVPNTQCDEAEMAAAGKDVEIVCVKNIEEAAEEMIE
ncbi:MAG: S16 family serine protease [Candidatus Micrarchaeota archaeon]